jgi:hypothetical protein
MIALARSAPDGAFFSEPGDLSPGSLRRRNPLMLLSPYVYQSLA